MPRALLTPPRWPAVRRPGASFAALELAAAALLFPPRFAIMAVAEVLAYMACWVATAGHDPALPLANWRRRLVQRVVVPCCRVVLATVGVWSVRVRGAPDPAAKVVVCNHVCLLDGFVMVACLGAPSFVARREGLVEHHACRL